MVTTSARTARTPHPCSDCRETIPAGHRYLRHVRFPDEINTNGRPQVDTQCIACACEQHYAADLDAGACGTYCHGTDPCARPFRHSGDCSCRQDTPAPAPVPA